jgi:selenide, water dikinase
VLQGGWLWTAKDAIDRAFMAKYGSDLPLQDMMQHQSMSAAAASSGSSSWLWSWGNLGTTTSTWPSGGGGSSSNSLPGAYAVAGAEGEQVLASMAMRCGGCGSKVGSSTLTRVLNSVRAEQQQQQQKSALQPCQVDKQTDAGGALSILGADDAAVLPAPPPGELMVSTLDYFRSPWPDAYVLGAIAANHALGV